MTASRKLTVGAQLEPSRLAETRAVLNLLTPAAIGELDDALGAWAERPLGREALAAAVLPALGSVFVCLNNTYPAGLIVLARSGDIARVHMLTVVPDMRRKGLAYTMLALARNEGGVRDLKWMWMTVPSGNESAVRTALACGFRRYVPQFLRRSSNRWLSINAGPVHAQPAGLDDIEHWLLQECEAGDGWCSDLVRAHIAGRLLPDSGYAHALMCDGRRIGLAHVTGTREHPVITLFGEASNWGQARDLNCIKAVLNTLGEQPAHIDLHFGSETHTRAAYALLKPMQFKPLVKPQMLMFCPLGESAQRN